MLEKLLSLFAGIGLAVLLIIAASGNLSSQKQEVKAATETAIATTEKSEATTAENRKQIQKKYLAMEIQKTQSI